MPYGYHGGRGVVKTKYRKSPTPPEKRLKTYQRLGFVRMEDRALVIGGQTKGYGREVFRGVA
jgi:hypothetical protein